MEDKKVIEKVDIQKEDPQDDLGKIIKSAMDGVKELEVDIENPVTPKGDEGVDSVDKIPKDKESEYGL